MVHCNACPNATLYPPVVFALNAQKPTAVLFEAVLHTNEPYPTAVLFAPVTLKHRVLIPIAVFEQPVVLLNKLLAPNDVLLAPVVVHLCENAPTAVL